MLYNLFSLLSFITLTFGLKRSFTPDKPEVLKYNNDKIWLWLDRECFSTKSEVFSFRDELLSNYECLKYNHEKHKDRIFYCGTDDSMWSLWLDLDGNDFSCLNNEIELDIDSKCVHKVVHEPLQHITRMDSFTKLDVNNILDRLKPKQEAVACTSQTYFGGFTYTQMASLDLMDGKLDGEYRNNDASNNNVVAIILDEGVDFSHVEFTGLSTGTLDNFDLSKINTFDHGTHVAGTVVGVNVGGAKGTGLLNYPVCQSNSGCSWSDIEIGYNSAIAQMQSTSSTRYVINYSVGGSKSVLTTPQYDSWGNSINSASGIWVTSAGNSRGDACNFSPAYNTNAFTVGSLSINTNTGVLTDTTWFTNYGSCVDFWAPGEQVISAAPGGAYASMSGTSMASPGICGLAINIIRDNFSASQNSIRSTMRSNSNTINANSNTAPNNYAAYYAGCN